MNDLLDDADSGTNAPEFSVSELSGAVKRLIEGEFSHVRIRGELGRISRPPSGHLYLDLKDDRAVIAGVMWKGTAKRLTMRPEEGMEVIATGRLTTFPGQSKYQLVIEDMRPAGVGALMAMLEKRKAQLQSEGLFDPARKRPIPYLPEVIGVITSPTGAVIRDILHRLRDRFPRKVLIWPVPVQGEKCAPEVSRAIAGFNALTTGGAIPRPDLIIVARGGGSVEDLWGFNEESVARAAAASDIPLISAVGHETDTTLIDFVSDKRAPTPTAAAEMAVPVRMELLSWVDEQQSRLSRALTTGVSQRRQRLSDLARALPRPATLLDGPRQRLDGAGGALPAALIRSVQTRRVALSHSAGALRPSLLRSLISNEKRQLSGQVARLAPALSRSTDNKKARLNALRLSASPIAADLARKARDLRALEQRLSHAANAQTNVWANKLSALGRLRDTLGYKETLKRGYAVVRSHGAVVTSSAAARAADNLEIQFADGRIALDRGAEPAPPTRSKPAQKKPRKPAPQRPDAPPEQGSLF